MKKHFLFSLVGFGLIVASAQAATAQNNNANDAVRLPVYHVEAPRLTEAELKVQQSLAELRATAKPAPQAMKVELPALAQHPAAQPAPKAIVAAR